MKPGQKNPRPFKRKYALSDREKLFKNKGGNLLTYGLIHGLRTTPVEEGSYLYTIKDEDYGDLPSLKRLYIEMRDPTEILFANKYFFSYAHWKLLCKYALKDYIDDWRDELETLLRAEALQNLQDMASDESSKHFYQANKMLLDRGWKERENTTIAAKERIKKKAEEMHQAEMEIQEDAKLLESFQKERMN